MWNTRRGSVAEVKPKPQQWIRACAAISVVDNHLWLIVEHGLVDNKRATFAAGGEHFRHVHLSDTCSAQTRVPQTSDACLSCCKAPTFGTCELKGLALLQFLQSGCFAFLQAKHMGLFHASLSVDSD